MSWLKVAPLNAIEPLGSRVLETEQGTIALFRTSEDKVFALEDTCPHKKGPLSQGIVHGCKVTCPLHNWIIELETGEALAPDEGHTQGFETKIENDWVYLNLASAK